MWGQCSACEDYGEFPQDDGFCRVCTADHIEDATGLCACGEHHWHTCRMCDEKFVAHGPFNFGFCDDCYQTHLRNGGGAWLTPPDAVAVASWRLIA